MNVPRIELAPGYSISRIIRGGWQLSVGHHQAGVDEAAAIEGMRLCAETGITTFDCADIYTGVEELIGRFLRTHRDERPIQIHTKYVPDLDSLATLTPQNTVAVIDRSLQRLGIQRLDLVQFHWWDYDIPGYVEAAHTLDNLRLQGKVRHIGVTNFDVAHLSEILDAGVPVVSNQVQYSVLDRRPATDMATYCASHRVSLLCYGTLAGGFLTDRYLNAPPPQEPFENRSLTKYRLIIEEIGGWSRYQNLLQVLRAIADKHGTNIAAIASRYVLDQPQVAGAIIGMRSNHRIAEAHRLFDLPLSSDDLGLIDACLTQSAGPRGPVFGLERIKDGRHAGIMKMNLGQPS
ncbi:aldo/keto reductase [Candidatus Bipolaricaulota bacterium]|nr:aldo/keto reductase [Candidatus Bipolaricaulota bacterium]TFH09335.1 MAG: aldo/keto reductase [Candidatus Atribacteria bacterium]